MLDLETGRQAIHRDIAAIHDRLESLDAETWRRPSGLPGWTIADLTNHLVWGQSLQAGAWERMRRGDTEVFVPPVSERSDPDELLHALDKAHTSFLEALDAVDEEDLESSCPLPYGTIPARFVLQVAVMEAGTHRFDLEQALDGAPSLSPDVVRASATVLAGTLPTLAAAGEAPSDPLTVRLRGTAFAVDLSWSADGWRPAQGDGQAVTFEGSDAGLVLFALGRADAEEAGVRVHGGDGVDGAAAFKRWFPGP